MVRHGQDPCGPVAGTVQMRLATRSTGDDYVTGKLWCLATVNCCPWHPEGGCGFCRHGTYPRVKPVGTRIARWYCPTARRTLSALPDCLASHYSGTLDDVEAHVRAVEQAPSLLAATVHLRTDIELPGALRYLSRLCRAIHSALRIVRGLDPATFLTIEPSVSGFANELSTDSVLICLREQCARHLPQLPTPLGFNPPRTKPTHSTPRVQHQTGRDPPQAIVESAK